MTFTYDLVTVTDLTRVRFHLQDTVEATAIFSDEEIAFAISEYGTYQKAVVALIKGILAKISNEPDMTQDWLRVDWRRSADHWRKLLSDKEVEFGVGGVRASSGGRHPYRADNSTQKTTPDYGET